VAENDYSIMGHSMLGSMVHETRLFLAMEKITEGAWHRDISAAWRESGTNMDHCASIELS